MDQRLRTRESDINTLRDRQHISADLISSPAPSSASSSSDAAFNASRPSIEPPPSPTPLVTRSRPVSDQLPTLDSDMIMSHRLTEARTWVPEEEDSETYGSDKVQLLQASFGPDRSAAALVRDVFDGLPGTFRAMLRVWPSESSLDDLYSEMREWEPVWRQVFPQFRRRTSTAPIFHQRITIPTASSSPGSAAVTSSVTVGSTDNLPTPAIEDSQSVSDTDRERRPPVSPPVAAATTAQVEEPTMPAHAGRLPTVEDTGAGPISPSAAAVVARPKNAVEADTPAVRIAPRDITSVTTSVLPSVLLSTSPPTSVPSSPLPSPRSAAPPFAASAPGSAPKDSRSTDPCASAPHNDGILSAARHVAPSLSAWASKTFSGPYSDGSTGATAQVPPLGPAVVPRLSTAGVSINKVVAKVTRSELASVSTSGSTSGLSSGLTSGLGKRSDAVECGATNHLPTRSFETDQSVSDVYRERRTLASPLGPDIVPRLSATGVGIDTVVAKVTPAEVTSVSTSGPTLC